MNNSRISLDNVFDEPEVDRKPQLREQESELVKIIEALGKVAGSKDWSTLKNTVFAGVVETLETKLKAEASKDDPDKMVLAKINGQLVWARKYVDLDSLTNVFRLQLTQVRTLLYGKTPKES